MSININVLPKIYYMTVLGAAYMPGGYLNIVLGIIFY